MHGKGWRRLPWILVYVRFVCGLLLWALAAVQAKPADLVAVLTASFLSDVFDGVIARRLQVVTARFRVADSRADTVYYVCVAVAVWRLHPEIVRDYAAPLTAIIGFQLLSYGIDLLRYGRVASFHAYMAKAWGITLFLASVAILGFGLAWPFLWIAIIVGFLGNIEGMAMVWVLPEWTHDVPSLWHAMRLRDAKRRAAELSK